VVIVCPKTEETVLSPYLRSKSVTDGRKCPKIGTQKPDHLIQTGSKDPVRGIATGACFKARTNTIPTLPNRKVYFFYPEILTICNRNTTWAVHQSIQRTLFHKFIKTTEIKLQVIIVTLSQ